MSEKSFVRFVMDLVEKPVSAHIPSYDDLYEYIGDSYVYACYENIRSIYDSLIITRKKLSGYEILDFNNPGFQNDAVSFLDSVYKLFLLYTSQSDSRCFMSDDFILKKITEGDMERRCDGTIAVGLGNPLIMEALVEAALYTKDFGRHYGTDVHDAAGKVRGKIYREYLYGGVDRLFRGITLVYCGDFYDISFYDEKDGCFVATRRQENEDHMAVSTLCLYEHIARAVEGRKDALRVFIAGNAEERSVDLLKRLTKCLNVKIDWDGGKLSYAGRLMKSTLDDMLEGYDEIYIMNCSDTYSPFAVTTRDDLRHRRTAMRSTRVYDVDLKTDNLKDFFFGTDLFSDSYYTVQYFFYGLSICGMRKTGIANGAFFDYLMKKVDGDEKFASGKDLSVYVTGGTDLERYTDDRYVRVYPEAESFGDYESLEVGRMSGIGDSVGTKLEMTYFDILSAISTSYEFYCAMTGVGSEAVASDDDVIKAVERAHDTRIGITYGAIKDKDDDGKRFELNVEVSCHNEEPDGKYENTVSTVVQEMFSVCRRETNGEDRVLSDMTRRHKAAMGGVLYERAKDFGDMLFCHIYAGEDEDAGGISFKIDKIEFNVTCSEENEDVREVAERRVRKHSKNVAGYLMDNLDGRYYRESSMVYQLSRVDSSRQKLNDYVCGLAVACGKLEYTGSMLFDRAKKYL